MKNKLPKRDVDYRKAAIIGQRCGVCSMFVKSDNGVAHTCTDVEGEIDTMYVCDIFVHKSFSEH